MTGGNSARFAAVPLAGGGTPMREWVIPPTAALDLTECPGLIVVAPHPDDETLGLGAMAAQLAAAGVNVTVVSVSDGGAAEPAAPRAQRLQLESRRRSELCRAAEVLGIRTRTSLGLPDGRLAGYVDELTDSLTAILDEATPGTWCAATWRGDGHPDHEAVGRAAAGACARTGATLLEYPIWMWHWARPSDPAVQWERARSVPVPAWAHDRKRLAAHCFRSQFEASGPGRAPVLPAFVLQRLLAVGELVFV